MNSIVPGPWLPPIWQQSIDELHATIAEKEAEIQRLLRVYRAAIFMMDRLRDIGGGAGLPNDYRRSALAAILYVEEQFPEFGQLLEEGL